MTISRQPGEDVASRRSSACGRRCRTSARAAAGRGSCRSRTGSGTARRCPTDAVELRQDQREGEEDRVVEEGLPDEQRRGRARTASGRASRRSRRSCRTRSPCAAGRLRYPSRLARAPAPVDSSTWRSMSGRALGLLVAPVDEQPPRALGHVAADEQDAEPEDRAEAEREPPADVLGEEGRVRAGRREQRAPTAVPSQNEPLMMRSTGPADPRRDQLVDRGVDGGVLAADAGAGEEAADEEPQEVLRERREDGGHEVDAPA